jgi:hypothetical protein
MVSMLRPNHMVCWDWLECPCCYNTEEHWLLEIKKSKWPTPALHWCRKCGFVGYYYEFHQTDCDVAY